jgi:hypothetical protein
VLGRGISPEMSPVHRDETRYAREWWEHPAQYPWSSYRINAEAWLPTGSRRIQSSQDLRLVPRIAARHMQISLLMSLDAVSAQRSAPRRAAAVPLGPLGSDPKRANGVRPESGLWV